MLAELIEEILVRAAQHRFGNLPDLKKNNLITDGWVPAGAGMKEPFTIITAVLHSAEPHKS